MERYSRNIQINGIGEVGQQKLEKSKVLIVGVGGLGSPVVYYLAAAGIGTLGIIDPDKVQISNLQRQILHTTKDLHVDKVSSAKEKIEALNPGVNIITYNIGFSQQNAESLISSYDFIVDCSDNYDTKYLINDVCVKLEKPFSHAAVVAMQGEVMTIVPGTACYRCVFPEPPNGSSTADDIGVLGAMAGIIGSVQATEVVKYLTGVGELLTNKLLIIDGKNMSFHTLKVKRIKNCGSFS